MNASRRAPRESTQGSSRGGTIATVLFLLVFAGFLLWRSKSNTPSEDALLRPDASTKPRNAASVPKKASSADGVRHKFTYSPNDTDQDVANKRLARARNTLEGYKLWARYPPTSRPLSEMPDLQKPHSVQPSTQPLAMKDGKVTQKGRVTLSQDRLYLVGDETAQLQITCQTPIEPGPCEMISAQAMSSQVGDQAVAVGPSPVNFVDNGKGGVIASFTPAKEGFSSYHGPIGIDAQVRIGSEEGRANFQVIYTPAAPARFTGKIREVLENGSLCLYLQMDVTKAGRYVIVGRVDDAEGEGFGYLELNDLVESGLREVRMCVFGLLVLDQRAKTPFTLRDVEGFLLFENRDPDRELMSVLEGKVYTTKTYPESAFSAEEWQSEEKTRTLDEFGKDVEKGIDNGGDP